MKTPLKKRTSKFMPSRAKGHSVLSRAKGFTLIETVIYIGLFAFVMSFSVLIFYQVLSSETQNRLRRQTEIEADFIMRKLVWALTGAQTVSQPASGGNSSTLTLTKYNFVQNPLTFDLSSGVMRLSRAGGNAVALNNSNVDVTALNFYHIPQNGAEPEAVQITLTLQSKTENGLPPASTTLNNTIYLK